MLNTETAKIHGPQYTVSCKYSASLLVSQIILLRVSSESIVAVNVCSICSCGFQFCFSRRKVCGERATLVLVLVITDEPPSSNIFSSAVRFHFGAKFFLVNNEPLCVLS